MFLKQSKKNNVYPCKPQFYYIKVEFEGVRIIKACFRDDLGLVGEFEFKIQNTGETKTNFEIKLILFSNKNLYMLSLETKII